MWKRWNQNSHIWERSTNNGSSWTPLPINTASINEGTFAKAIQHPQTVYQDQVPTFTGGIKLYSQALEFGKWAAYTPTWASNGTAPAIGNGQLRGRFTKIDKTIAFNFELVGGSTTNWGTGMYAFGTPTDILSAYTGTNFPVFFGNAYHAATTFYFGCMALIAGATTFNLIDIKSQGGVSNTTPFAFASGDFIRINGVYEST